MSAHSAWSSLTTTQKVLLAVGLPAGAAVAYVFYRRYSESLGEHCVLVGDNQIAVDMKVPRDSVKLIVGRQGTTIQQLRRETGARIDMEGGEEWADEGGAAERKLTIVGAPVQVCKARAAIRRLLAHGARVTEELHVPPHTVGRIIGRGGESIRAMCRATGARIVCEKHPGDGAVGFGRVVSISGTKQEVTSAKALVVAKMEEEEMFRQQLACSAAGRRHRKHPAGRRTDGEMPSTALAPGQSPALAPAPAAPGSPQRGEWMPGHSREEEQEHRTEPTLGVGGEEDTAGGERVANHQHTKFEIPSPDFSFLADEHLEVYVSASENPGHFWIQILGSRCLQLDNLCSEMSRYYNNSSTAGEAFVPKMGDIVAAPFQNDGFWYRACVLGFLQNGNADLYYVDYGDNGEAALANIQVLRSDFLSLPFQAVECSLDGIRPVGESWSEEAMNCFDGLAHCAEWKVLLARICSYLQSEGVTRPRVQLFDRSQGKSVDIGEELVRQGHAVRCPRGDGATAADGADTHWMVAPTNLQTLLNDVTGATDGCAVSEATAGSTKPQLSESWQSFAGHPLGSSSGAVPADDEFL
ncbi:tudor and KH domain-containing protein [Amblyraja radiata]|uniref:tudor and KH domain-containing protein n=1 Tax=Amblyraja radiata TaxID=386614 RepID=UPI001403DF63|nr:tudor and KH domain-containing protein [Amblyraja radiata]